MGNDKRRHSWSPSKLRFLLIFSFCQSPSLSLPFYWPRHSSVFACSGRFYMPPDRPEAADLFNPRISTQNKRNKPQQQQKFLNSFKVSCSFLILCFVIISNVGVFIFRCEVSITFLSFLIIILSYLHTKIVCF